MPSTSAVKRQSIRRSNFFEDFPITARPAGLRMPDHPGLGGIAWSAAEALDQRFPPIWPGPFTPRTARDGLTTWCLELAVMIEESSRLRDIDSALAKGDPVLVGRMQRWLDGQWSADRDALERLCWHVGLSRPTTSAAMWLHRFGAFAKG
jgi:hypothetical protein